MACDPCDLVPLQPHGTVCLRFTPPSFKQWAVCTRNCLMVGLLGVPMLLLAIGMPVLTVYALVTVPALATAAIAPFFEVNDGPGISMADIVGCIGYHTALIFTGYAMYWFWNLPP